MKTFCAAFLVLPGKSEAAKEFAKTLAGPRYREFEGSEERLHVSKEAFFLQKTPQGDFVIVYFEADDVRWFKDQVKEITGVDLDQPGGPPPEQILAFGY